jgi:uncharacterized membrane protein YbaN (DUF454 family)
MSKKLILFACGWLALILGIIGVFLPLLPTTPFVLLASWCFARSSRRFHSWLANHRWTGPMIQRWEAGEGITTKVRNRAIGVLWLTLILSMIIVGKWWSPLLLGSIGIACSCYLVHLSRMSGSTAGETGSSATQSEEAGQQLMANQRQ